MGREQHNRRLAVVGGYGTGITVTTDRVPDGGETVLSSGLEVGPGGKGSNQAIGAARLGVTSTLLTAVGQDSFGSAAFELWADEGVDAEWVRRVDAPTMAGVILVESGGENRILVVPGALDHLGPADADRFEPSIASAAALLVSLEVPLDLVTRACEIAAGHGVPVIVNPAPAVPLPDRLWGIVDFLTPNRTEAATLAGLPTSTSAADVAWALRERTGAAIVLTMGAAGALLVDHGGQERHLSAPSVPVIDTTGAGDAFNAAFAVALTCGASLEAAVAYGIRAGSHAVGIRHVVPSLPRLADIGHPETAHG